MIEIGDKIDVFIQARKYAQVDAFVYPLPVGISILIVVVVDEFVVESRPVFVIYVDLAPGQDSTCIIIVIHAISLAKKEPRLDNSRQIHHPAIALVKSRQVFCMLPVGVFSVTPTAVEFAVEIKPRNIVRLQSQAENFSGGRQTVRDLEDCEIGAIFDIFFGSGRQQKHVVVLSVILAIRRHLDSVVVGNHQFKSDSSYLRGVGTSVGPLGKIVY